MIQLKTLREAAGLSCEELAQKAGLPLNDIERYERVPGTIERAYVEVGVALAQALGMTVSVFAGQPLAKSAAHLDVETT
ncbi:MAG: helix-turn-helix transcriptional regulator [Clostridia bacterium]